MPKVESISFYRILSGHCGLASTTTDGCLKWALELENIVANLESTAKHIRLADEIVIAYAYAVKCYASRPGADKSALGCNKTTETLCIDEREWRSALLKGDTLPSLFGEAPMLSNIITYMLSLPETRVGAHQHVLPESPDQDNRATKRRKLCPAHSLLKRTRPEPSPDIATSIVPLELRTDRQKILLALRLLRHFSTAPWASQYHEPNSAVMTRFLSSALPIIVGHSSPIDPADSMLLSEDPDVALGENYVWITNRQQGKTTTIARLLAVLSVVSGKGGSLLGVYSTKYERASELVFDARRYIEWLKTDRGAHPDWPPSSIKFVKCTQQMYSLETPFTPKGSPNEVKSRPTRANTCRGDYFPMAVFDEIAFTSESFFNTFALPLLQNLGRRFLCVTTPPPPGSFFDNFCARVRLQEAAGNKFFQLVNHSLACPTCVELDKAAECCHNIHQIPEWKCISAVMTTLKSLVGDSFAAEVFGVIGAKFRACFPKDLVNATFEATKITKIGQVNKIWIGVDPAYHSQSEMAMVAAVCGDMGSLVIVGAATVPVHATEIIQIQALVSEFCKNVRKIVGRGPPIVPIVECNASHVAARSILSAIENNGPVEMPFLESVYKKGVVDRVGVLTTHATKQASVECALQILVDARLKLYKSIASADRTAFSKTAKVIPAHQMLNTLKTQMTLLTHTEKGEISGKGSDGQNDDLAMALLMLILWRAVYLKQHRSFKPSSI